MSYPSPFRCIRPRLNTLYLLYGRWLSLLNSWNCTRNCWRKRERREKRRHQTFYIICIPSRKGTNIPLERFSQFYNCWINFVGRYVNVSRTSWQTLMLLASYFIKLYVERKVRTSSERLRSIAIWLGLPLGVGAEWLFICWFYWHTDDGLWLNLCDLS